MIIQTALNEGIKKLKANNIRSSLLDCDILMSEALCKTREYIILNSQNNLKQKNFEFFKYLINERAKGKPISYLTKKKFFWKYEFCVSKDTLIPRPDTELLIEEVLKITKNKNKINVLDIGVGSGCILLSILKEKQNFFGTGIDISKNCLNISKMNAKKLKVNSRVRFYKSDVDKFDLGKYDLIVSNPPYINKHKLKYLEKDVVDFEPKIALCGGLDGLSEIRKVINKSSELIKKNGKFILEVGFNQKNSTINLLRKEGFYINSILKDFAKIDRCIVSTKI